VLSLIIREWDDVHDVHAAHNLQYCGKDVLPRGRPSRAPGVAWHRLSNACRHVGNDEGQGVYR
jgi:hypothetical protein